MKDDESRVVAGSWLSEFSNQLTSYRLPATTQHSVTIVVPVMAATVMTATTVMTTIVIVPVAPATVVPAPMRAMMVVVPIAPVTAAPAVAVARVCSGYRYA
jgi:hypothetical protein